MVAVVFSPIFNGNQSFTPSGLPLSGGFLNTYVAGSTTPLQTYTTSAGSVQSPNPIQFGPDGRPPQEIWLLPGIAYKFVLTDSLSNSIATYDNIVGIQQTPQQIFGTVNQAVTFISASQFSVPGDFTTTFVPGIRIAYTLTATQFYGTVTASIFNGTVTTVTVLTDTTPLTSALNSVSASVLIPGQAVPNVFTQTVALQKGASVGNTNQTDPTVLDWYLEQSFTPTWSGAILPGVTTGTLSGYGVRVGSMFFFTISAAITSATGTGNAVIGGFPYVPNATNASFIPISTNFGGPLAIRPGSGATYLVCNSTTLAFIPANSPSNNQYFITGFYPV